MFPIQRELKQLVKLGIPLMAAFISQKGMQLVDAVMMGRIGSRALAAGVFGTGAYLTLTLFSLGLLSAVGVLIAAARGEEKLAEIPSILRSGFFQALILVVPGIAAIIFVPDFLWYIGQNHEVVALTRQLLLGLVWGFPGMLLFLILREFISAFELARIVMLVTALSIPVTFIANYILIYGKFGFPALGIRGIGYAGAFVQWLMFLCLFIYAKIHPKLNSHFSMNCFKEIDWKKIRHLFRIGMPSGMILILDASSAVAAGVLLGYLGAIVLAAHQIVMQCVSFIYAVPFALSMATALRVSHVYAESGPQRAQLVAFLGIGMAMVIAALVTLMLILFSKSIVQIFINTASAQYVVVHAVAKQLFFIAGLFLIFDAMQAVTLGALRGLQDTTIPMLVNALCFWLVGFSCGYFLTFHTSIGARGVWIGLALGISSSALLLFWRLCYQIKQLKKKLRVYANVACSTNMRSA